MTTIFAVHNNSVTLVYCPTTGPYPRAEVRGEGPGTPQAIQGIVNTLFWLYWGLTFQSPKIKLLPPDGRFLG